MPKVVSIIPADKETESGAHKVRGSKILLDDGSYLEGAHKVTLVADVQDGLWRAIIEVRPTKQSEISAQVNAINISLLDDRKAEIVKNINVLKAEYEYLESLGHEQSSVS